MKLLNKVRTVANQLVSWTGFEVSHINPSTMDRGLLRLPKRHVKVESVIDVGAARGEWTDLAHAAFPAAKILMVEALEEQRQTLAAKCQARPELFSFHIGAAGRDIGEGAFWVSDDLDGSAALHGKLAGNPKVRTVPMTTIDELTNTHGLKGPHLLKLDTHGFEIPILEGATETLKNCSIVVIEGYVFRGKDDPRLLFWEMCEWMMKHGFRCFDLVDPLCRKKDGALWQMDLFFARIGSPLFADTAFR